MTKRVSIEVSSRLLEAGETPDEDLFRATVKTRNHDRGGEDDQSGLMTHTEVKRKDLETFWDGVDAVARTWDVDGIGRPDDS